MATAITQSTIALDGRAVGSVRIRCTRLSPHGAKKICDSGPLLKEPDRSRQLLRALTRRRLCVQAREGVWSGGGRTASGQKAARKRLSGDRGVSPLPPRGCLTRLDPHCLKGLWEGVFCGRVCVSGLSLVLCRNQ